MNWFLIFRHDISTQSFSHFLFLPTQLSAIVWPINSVANLVNFSLCEDWRPVLIFLRIMYIFLSVVATHSCCRCCCRRSQQIKISEMSLTGEEKKELKFILYFDSVFSWYTLARLARQAAVESRWFMAHHKTDIKLSSKSTEWQAKEKEANRSTVRRVSFCILKQAWLLSLPIRAAATIGVRTTLIAMIWMLIDLFILVPVNERHATIILCHIAAAKRLEVEQEKMKLMHTTTTERERKSNIIKSKMVIDVSTHNQRRARRTSTQIRSRVVQKVIKTCYMKIFIIAHASSSDLSPIQSQNAHSVCQPTRERWLDEINDANKTLKWLCSLFVSCLIHTRRRSSLSLAEFYGL